MVQLYAHARSSRVRRADKELRGFQRISLQPGEKRTVTFQLPAEKLAYWDETRHQFAVEPGLYDLWVGGSSADMEAKGRLRVGR